MNGDGSMIRCFFLDISPAHVQLCSHAFHFQLPLPALNQGRSKTTPRGRFRITRTERWNHR